MTDDFDTHYQESMGYKRSKYRNLRKDGLTHDEAMDQVKKDDW